MVLKEINLNFNYREVIMKKLYGIAELHPTHEPFDAMAKISRSIKTGLNYIDDVLEDLAKAAEFDSHISKLSYQRKIDATKRLLKTIKPKIFFVEGDPKTETSLGFLKDIDYKGDVIFLDEGYQPIEGLFKRHERLTEEFEKIHEKTKKDQRKADRLIKVGKFLKSLPKPLQKVALPFYNRTLKKPTEYSFVDYFTKIKYLGKLNNEIGNEMRKIKKSKRDNIDREQFWKGKISENFREPAMILTGKAHQIPGLVENTGKLPEFLKEGGIELEIVYEEPSSYS